jgi:light-regulated signal transduction histidine kinase (bacteriophytochrome)
MVDDQPGKLLTYETILSELGENLLAARSAREALEHLLRTPISIILIDVNMPELNGFELASLIRQHPRYQQMAIIFVSAVHHTHLDQLKGYEHGAADYITVPIVPELLRAKVRVFAELHRKTAALQWEIAKRERAEREIQTLNEQLEQRILQRTTQLEAANKELEAFAYSVSHNLRAPLRSLDGFSLYLLQHCLEKLDARERDYLQRVRAASQRMGQLIDDLLNLSRLTRLDLCREVVDMSVLARTIAGELRQTQPHRHVEWVIADGLVVHGDRRLLGLMLENLLGNAWKFTAKLPQAQVEVGSSPHAGKTVYYVRDNGAGFDMAYADQLFAPFQRLHTLAEFEGTGVGLATVQRIIHHHGGRIWAEGAVDQGATFYFTL